ncbi:hypothetical protein EC912_11150 [Luteibacter rhizovicinus]|uniref:Uncharacterized protein n=1 Tax=Luteibacter rhizovicinus TaxID=242606 RepID=A0A4R3YGR5_9GAMM|nr:hypothetical protein EC912_11150 [Luteibacter rhizovicinus]
MLYLGRSEFLPWHSSATGRSWRDIDERMRTLLLALIRLLGWAYLAAAFAGFCGIYVTFFAAGGLPSLLVLQCLGLLVAIPPLMVTMRIRASTGASTPVWPVAAVVALFTMGIVLMLVSTLCRA